jgi:tetratricopeptide (TPR) repeat protein
MFELKALSPAAVPAALEKALRYRTLNEPEQAESICEDVLRVEPDNQEALAMLILARTDRFTGPRPATPKSARDLLPRLQGEYERAYYAGIIAEREGIAWLRSPTVRSGAAAFECFRQAMASYERAAEARPPDNDDALLRWNSCARMIMRHPDLRPHEEAEEVSANLGE